MHLVHRRQAFRLGRAAPDVGTQQPAAKTLGREPLAQVDQAPRVLRKELGLLPGELSTTLAQGVTRLADLERLERQRPAAPGGPAVQYLSADGAMVPLVGGQWAEVKTLAIGVVEARVGEDGLPEAHTTDLTYFSRMADAETFTHQAYVETYRRGTDTAGVVCAAQGGAEWEQGLVDVLRPDAVRILDFPHALDRSG